LAAFTEESGIEVELVPSGDAGQVVNRSVLNADNPLGDVLFGIDNTFLTRALEADIFVPHESPRLDVVDDRFELDPAEHRVTPIDHGEVCVNFDKSSGEPPASFDELLDRAGDLVVENPATSSPGLAFLLATIAEYGEDGWQDWWRAAADAGVTVTSGWEEAYYTAFSGGSGEGDKPLVVSYATSPPVEVVFADPPVDDAPTGVVTSTCFEQIEMAGILRGTEHEEEAGQLIDFLLGDAFQADIPLQMYVFPVVDVELPEVFTEHAAIVESPLSMSPAEIDEGRERWIDEWTSIVLG
ncbi:MAG TPA: thiamine ABC transporter substrate-binding protein, partial [Acidimicrobiales bacterium]|nr:thiamine ABC transporter substrate-binding protein [Acidimicrobiales bacterium]